MLYDLDRYEYVIKMESSESTLKSKLSSSDNEGDRKGQKRRPTSNNGTTKAKKKRLHSSSEVSARKIHRSNKPGKGKQKHHPRNDKNNFKFRHGGSISDPLNLLGMDGRTSECSTCVTSPADTPSLNQSPLASQDYYSKDPLHLADVMKGKVKKAKVKEKRKKKRLTSSSEALEEKEEVKDEVAEEPQKAKKKTKPDPARFKYGNYNRYYGYRNEGQTRDPRLDLLNADMFKGKEVLDIGCNTGQLTIAIAQEFHPHCITGIDIDKNLISTAQKNVLRCLPQPTYQGVKVHFPISIVMTYGPLISVAKDRSDDGNNEFPQNIQFKEVIKICIFDLFYQFVEILQTISV